MKLLLTRDDGAALMVETDQIKLMEKDASGKAHIVFGADMGRTVQESFDQVLNAMGAVKVVVPAALSGMPQPK